MLNIVKENWPLARDHLDQAINPAEPNLYDDNQVTTLTLVALLNKGLGYADLAEQRLLQAERVIGHARVNGIEDAESYYSVACIFAMRGEKERALQALQQAYDKGWRKLWMIEIDGRLDNVRNEPAFTDLKNQLSIDLISANDEVRGILETG